MQLFANLIMSSNIKKYCYPLPKIYIAINVFIIENNHNSRGNSLMSEPYN
ncbi:hypothetical protein GGR07_001613 [Bacteroides pyogenes]|nr:hypothetical protein [Bacteroides pyogenes]SUV70586.1 Uncharacterised protein [Bacteroides pyogenes]